METTTPTTLIDVTVRFLRHSFTGQTARREQEWPPSPVRIFSALVAGAGQNHPQAREALGFIETMPAPRMWFGSVAHNPVRVSGRSASQTPVPPSSADTGWEKFTGSVEFVGGSTPNKGPLVPHPGGVSLDEPTVTMRTRVPSGCLDDLRAAAREIGYVGRSQDHAVVTITEVPTDEDSDYAPAGMEHQPIPNRRGVRSWTPGLLEALNRRFAADDRSGGRLHFPAHPDSYTESMLYVPVVRTAGDLTGVRLDKGVAWHTLDTPGLRPMVDRWRGKIIGAVGEVDVVSAFIEANPDAVTDAAPPQWMNMFASPSAVWETATAALAPDRGTAVAATMAAVSDAGFPVESVDVVAVSQLDRPIADASSTRSKRGLLMWHVTVTLAEPCVVDVPAGLPVVSGAGVLVPSRR